MKKKLIGISIVLFLVISSSGVGYAGDPEYAIGYRYIQHRTLENGETVNLVAVAMKDIITGKLTEENVIKKLKLYRLDGDEETQYPVKLIHVVIWEELHEVFPWFNTENMKWERWNKESWSSYYSATIVEDLIPGTRYKIEVKCDDNNYYIDTVYFRDMIDLPVVPSNSFEYKFDEEGNFYWHWEIPRDMFYFGPEFHDINDTRPSLRANIEFYNNGKLTDAVSIKIPYLMGGVFVPATSEIFEIEADHIEIGVHLRINDSTYRSYSDFKTLNIRP